MTKEMKAYYLVDEQLVDVDTMSTTQLREALREMINSKGSTKEPEQEIIYNDLFNFEF
jgi:hypothetical protein